MVDSETLFSQVCRLRTCFFHLGLALANPCFRTASVGIRGDFSCSFPNGSAMGDQLMTRAEFVGITTTLTTTIKSLLDQMTTWTAKVDNNNANNNNNNNNRNNINNPNRVGEPIPVIRVINKYYTRLKDDYCNFKISNSIYRCPF